MASIKIGDEIIQVPNWATDATIQSLVTLMKKDVKTNDSALKYMQKVAANTESNKELLTSFTDSVEDVVTAVQDSATTSAAAIKDSSDKQLGQAVLLSHALTQGLGNLTRQQSDDAREESKEQRRAQTDHAKQLKQLTSAIGQVSRFNKDSLSELFNEVTSVFSQMASSLPLIGGALAAIGGAIGFTVSIIEDFAKTTSEMHNVGLGLNGNLISLRNSAGQLGMAWQDFGNVMSGSHAVLVAVGGNLTDGAQIFSDEITRIKNGTNGLLNTYGQFGLSNTELTAAIMEEAELLRARGVDESKILKMSMDGTTALYKEQTALAALTGTDRNERLRARQAMLANVDINEFLVGKTGQFATNIGNFSAELEARTGDLGSTISNTFASAISSGIDPAAINAPLMIALGDAGHELFQLFKSAEDFDTNEFQRILTEQVSTLVSDASFSSEQLSLFRSMGTEFAEIATQILSAKAALRSFEDIAGQDVTSAIQNYESVAEAGGLAIMGLNSAVESLTRDIRTSFLELTSQLIGMNESGMGDFVGMVEVLKSAQNTLFEKTTTGIDKTQELIEKISEMIDKISALLKLDDKKNESKWTWFGTRAQTDTDTAELNPDGTPNLKNSNHKTLTKPNPLAFAGPANTANGEVINRFSQDGQGDLSADAGTANTANGEFINRFSQDGQGDLSADAGTANGEFVNLYSQDGRVDLSAEIASANAAYEERLAELEARREAKRAHNAENPSVLSVAGVEKSIAESNGIWYRVLRLLEERL